VVGAGPTGVELAGAIGEIGLHTLAHDFRTIDPTQVRVLLFEAGDRVLSTYPPKLSEAARRSLERRRVQVRTGTKVTAIDDRGLTVVAAGATERIGARTVVWAAGVAASPLGAQLGAPRDRAGRVEVAPDLSVPGHPEVFVIGDLARMVSAGEQVPGVAQGAIQGGKHVAKIIGSEVAGRPARPPFRYRDKGNMATIGRASAVIATKHFTKHGLLAWLLWWAVHIMFLVGFRNRVFVMLQWAWSWLTFKRGARLITGPVGPLPPVRAIAPDGQPVLPEGARLVSLEPEAPAAPAPEPSRARPADDACA
jgi:NADH dehydrogenase